MSTLQYFYCSIKVLLLCCYTVVLNYCNATALLISTKNTYIQHLCNTQQSLINNNKSPHLPIFLQKQTKSKGIFFVSPDLIEAYKMQRKTVVPEVIHWSWKRNGAIPFWCKTFSELSIDGICWKLILSWRRLYIRSKANLLVKDQWGWVCSKTSVCWPHGHPASGNYHALDDRKIAGGRTWWVVRYLVRYRPALSADKNR